MKSAKKFDLMNSISWKNEFWSHEIRPPDPKSIKFISWTLFKYKSETYLRRHNYFCCSQLLLLLSGNEWKWIEYKLFTSSWFTFNVEIIWF